MQHNAADTVLRGLSTVRGGPAIVDSSGLRVVILHTSRARSGPELATLRLEELEPADPGWVLVINPGPVAVALDAGTALDGGMSMRAVCGTTAIPARSEVVVRVEPLGARWWAEGPLRFGLQVAPALMALVLQAALAGRDVAASARTAVWAIPPGSTAPAPPTASGAEVSGWAIEDERGYCAAWLGERTGSGLPLRSPDRHEHRAGERETADLVDSVRDGLRGGSLVAHVLEPGAGARDLVALPGDRRLSDRRWPI